MPCIRGLPILAASVVTVVAYGMTTAKIVAELLDLELADVSADRLRYAADALRERELPLRRTA